VRISLVDDAGTPGLEVAVVRGAVDVVVENQATGVGPGMLVFVRQGELPSSPEPFNSASSDTFIEWSQALLDARRGTLSAQYLPGDLVTYASTFDQYGSWTYQAPYGYVWYPTVAAAWRPYHQGHWRHFPGIGWTFISGDRWAWPTHHYGRWGLNPVGTWYWIPARGWSSAWVDWAVSPGYVGWCPLGWNNRPVVGFWNPRTGVVRHNPGRAWSVIPTEAFTHRTFVPRASITGQVAANVARPFIEQSTPPAIAVPRGTVGVLPGHGGPSRTGWNHERRPSTDTRPSAIVTRPAAMTPPAAVTRPAAVTPPALVTRSARVTRTQDGRGTPSVGYTRTPSPNGPPAGSRGNWSPNTAVPRSVGMPSTVSSALPSASRVNDGTRFTRGTSAMPRPVTRAVTPSGAPPMPSAGLSSRSSPVTAVPRTVTPAASPRMYGPAMAAPTPASPATTTAPAAARSGQPSSAASPGAHPRR
jgi:hypothetical protein